MLLIEGAHERSVYSISWGRGVVGRRDDGDDEKTETGTDKGLLASTGGDGKINVWSIKVSVSYPLSNMILINYSIIQF